MCDPPSSRLCADFLRCTIQSIEQNLIETNGVKTLTSALPVPTWWASRATQISAFLKRRVNPRCLQTLAVSPGHRTVKYAAYGTAEPHLRGSANFNSAVGAGDSEAYFRRQSRRSPCLLILAGVHGAEVEGMVGALSILSIIETGKDLRGRAHPVLAEKLRHLRLLVIPLANPDGRARVPYAGWVGLPTAEMHRVNQGTRRDGTFYHWPDCKKIHPMRGDVGFLGGYFDDDGVNLMHDEWSAPMSTTTKNLLKLVRDEAPDVVLNCHSYEGVPVMLPLAYAPAVVEKKIKNFTADYYRRLDRAGLSHKSALPQPLSREPVGAPPQSLNLTSMLYHVGAALPMTFESPHGLSDQPGRFSYRQILDLHHLLVETAADWLLPAIATHARGRGRKL